MGSVVKFYVWVIKIALVLGTMGVLKDATFFMAGKAVKAQQGMISYSKFTRMLTEPSEKRKAQVR
ncbi:MAG: hypothetical protein ACXWRE_06055 [Pseudobdellovibrionaceae bacterium]